MFNVSIKLPSDQLERIRKDLSIFDNAAVDAARRGINKAITGVRTDSVRLVRQDLSMKAKDVRDSMSIKKAKRSNLEAAVISEGKRISLIHFGARQQKKGVKVKVRKGRADFYPRAFIGTLKKSGKPAVFWRQKVGGRLVHRLKIDKLAGPSIPSFMGAKLTMGLIQAHAQKRLRKNLSHEIDREIKKRSKF